jgi:hypothetical protein
MITQHKGEQVPLVIHPVLTKYDLKLDSLDHDYDLPNEELSSPAVFPPMPFLKLESFQGYPQAISIGAFGDSQGADLTVQDVLRAIHEDLRKPCSKHEFNRLSVDERNAIRAAFKERCKTDDQRSDSLRKIDHLCGRDRLQILAKLPPDGALLPTSTLQRAEIL